MVKMKLMKAIFLPSTSMEVKTVHNHLFSTPHCNLTANYSISRKSISQIQQETRNYIYPYW